MHKKSQSGIIVHKRITVARLKENHDSKSTLLGFKAKTAPSMDFDVEEKVGEVERG